MLTSRRMCTHGTHLRVTEHTLNTLGLGTHIASMPGAHLQSHVACQTHEEHTVNACKMCMEHGCRAQRLEITASPGGWGGVGAVASALPLVIPARRVRVSPEHRAMVQRPKNKQKHYRPNTTTAATTTTYPCAWGRTSGCDLESKFLGSSHISTA